MKGRKRLRDYTEMRDGDVFVVAGVEFVYSLSRDGLLRRDGSLPGRAHYRGSHESIFDMLVDEHRTTGRIRRRHSNASNEVTDRTSKSESIRVVRSWIRSFGEEQAMFMLSSSQGIGPSAADALFAIAKSRR